MASWTTPVTHATGDLLAVSDWNGVANNETFLYEAPYAQYYASTATSYGNSSNTQTTLDTVQNSNYGFALTTSNAILPLTGTYWVTGQTGTSLASFVTFQGQIHQNGAQLTGDGVQYAMNPVALVYGAATDQIGLYGFNNSGATVTGSTGSNVTFLHLAFIGSQ